MGMTYGGQPCQDPQKIAEYLSKDTAFTLMRDWYGQANRFTCPLGDKPGRGLLLLTKDQLETIDIYTNTAMDLIVSDKLRRLTIKNLLPLKAYCVTPGADNDQRRIFALEVADPRYFLWQRHHTAAYNVRLTKSDATYDYIDETTSDGLGTAWTWDELGSELWTSLGITDTWPGWPFSPDSVPEGWHFWQTPAIQEFQAVARRLSCSLRYNPFDGTYGIVQLGAEDATFDASVESFKGRDRLWDEAWLEPYPHQVPANVRVVFRRCLAEADGNPYYKVDVAFPDAELVARAQSNTYAIVWDDLMYQGTNAAACSTRATERAADYARVVRYYNSNLYRHYRGVGTASDLFLGARCGSLSWQDTGKGIQTIIERGAMEPIDWPQYLHGVGEVMAFSECNAGNIVNTYFNAWGSRPLRFS